MRTMRMLGLLSRMIVEAENGFDAVVYRGVLDRGFVIR